MCSCIALVVGKYCNYCINNFEFNVIDYSKQGYANAIANNKVHFNVNKKK